MFVHSGAVFLANNLYVWNPPTMTTATPTFPAYKNLPKNTLENMQKCAGANEKKKIEQNNFNPSEIY